MVALLISFIRLLDVIPMRIMLGTPPSRFAAFGRGVSETSPFPASDDAAIVVYMNVGARRMRMIFDAHRDRFPIAHLHRRICTTQRLGGASSLSGRSRSGFDAEEGMPTARSDEWSRTVALQMRRRAIRVPQIEGVAILISAARAWIA